MQALKWVGTLNLSEGRNSHCLTTSRDGTLIPRGMKQSPETLAIASRGR